MSLSCKRFDHDPCCPFLQGMDLYGETYTDTLMTNDQFYKQLFTVTKTPDQ